jgi:hypothetical protein
MVENRNRVFEIKLHPVVKKEKSDIYTGGEMIQFKNRHPIFKALMKLEFEDVIRNYHKRICPR